MTVGKAVFHLIELFDTFWAITWFTISLSSQYSKVVEILIFIGVILHM